MAIRAEDIDLAHDRALVEAWQAGDAAAFDALYLRYFDRLRAFCQRRVGDRVDAEEIAQEAFTKAYKALPAFSGDRRFYPWMTVIAGRLCVDHHRRRARVQPADDIDTGWVDDGHDERLGLRVDLANLEAALDRLGPRHRDVLDLRERQELSYHQIATLMDVPHSTVEALLFRARRALRKEFQRVSAERLAGVPVLGWVGVRLDRWRHRLAQAGVDVTAWAAPLAAGAVGVLLAFPGGAPSVAAAAGTSPRTPVAVHAPVADAPPAPQPTSSTPSTPGLTPAALPVGGLTPMTDGDAQTQAQQMPVQLDLGPLGAGIDLDPVGRRLTAATERTHP